MKYIKSSKAATVSLTLLGKMSQHNSNKMTTSSIPQTLWGCPTLWVCPADKPLSTIKASKTTTTMLGHDKVEELRFHPTSSKHVVPGNPTSAEADHTTHSGYTVLRYSFDIGNGSSASSHAASSTQIVWRDTPSIQHFDYVRSRMKARDGIPLLPVKKGGLWVPQGMTVVRGAREQEPAIGSLTVINDIDKTTSWSEGGLCFH